MAHRRRVLLVAAAAAFVAAAALFVVLSGGSSTPTHLSEWYAGSWRVDGPMVGVSGGRLVGRPKAPPGTIVIAGDPSRLTVVMKGFPGVLPRPAIAQLDPLKLNYTTTDRGQATTAWAFMLTGHDQAAIAAFDATTGSYSANISLVRE